MNRQPRVMVHRESSPLNSWASWLATLSWVPNNLLPNRKQVFSPSKLTAKHNLNSPDSVSKIKQISIFLMRWRGCSQCAPSLSHTGRISPQKLPFSKMLGCEQTHCPSSRIKPALRQPNEMAWHCQSWGFRFKIITLLASGPQFWHLQQTN